MEGPAHVIIVSYKSMSTATNVITPIGAYYNCAYRTIMVNKNVLFEYNASCNNQKGFGYDIVQCFLAWCW